MLDHSCRQQHIGRHLNRAGVALIPDRIIGKHRLQHLVGPDTAGRLAPGQPQGALNLGPDQLRRRLQAVALFIHRVIELLRQLGKAIARPLQFQRLLDLRPHCSQRPGLARLNGGQLDDMKTEVGLHQIADFAAVQAKHRVIEGLDHHPAPKHPQIAAILCRARIVRMLFGQGRESRRLLPHLLQDRFRFGARRLFVGVRRTFRHPDQDVRCLALLGSAKLICMVAVILLDFGCRNRHFGGQPIGRQGEIFDQRLLRQAEFLRI